MSDLVNVLSLGAGVQSSTVLLMSCHGELPKLDHAVFADPQWEPEAVYRWFDEILRPACEKAGIELHVVTKGNIRQDALESKTAGNRGEQNESRWASMPWFVRNADGSQGMIRRQCTKEYKIEPVERVIRTILGLKRGQKWPKEQVVRQWFGISHDEIQRMKDSRRAAIVNWYPLVERRMTRGHCLEWLHRNSYPQAPRSACIGCPYRKNDQWRLLTRKEFDEAVAFDKQIRDAAGFKGKAYIHRSMQPLDEVDLTDPDENQISLIDECDGMCGV